MANMTTRPGDLILGDDDGVMVNRRHAGPDFLGNDLGRFDKEGCLHQANARWRTHHQLI